MTLQIKQILINSAVRIVVFRYKRKAKKIVKQRIRENKDRDSA